MPKTNNSAIIYEGESLIDGNPIIAIATGFNGNSNEKIGNNVVQVWIMRSDIRPSEAVSTKQDRSICGSCPLRGETCYVNTGFAPAQIYDSYQTGNYEYLSDRQLQKMRDYNKLLRLTAYGDMAAIGFKPVQSLVDAAKSTLGYTHSWSTNPDFTGRLMASVESVKTTLIARHQGWKTFRVKQAEDPLLPDEILCPNQVNPAIQCQDCRLCDGDSKNIAINVHGLDWKRDRFKQLTAKNS